MQKRRNQALPGGHVAAKVGTARARARSASRGNVERMLRQRRRALGGLEMGVGVDALERSTSHSDLYIPLKIHQTRDQKSHC